MRRHWPKTCKCRMCGAIRKAEADPETRPVVVAFRAAASRAGLLRSLLCDAYDEFASTADAETPLMARMSEAIELPPIGVDRR